MTAKIEQWYEVLPYALVRTAALPAETMIGLDFTRAREILRWPGVREALLAASPSFEAAVVRAESTGAWKPRDDVTLLKYVDRMSSRPTPFGLFAGVSVVGVDASTTALVTSPVRPRYQPDMGWLCSYIASVESQKDASSDLSFRTHPALDVQGARLTIHTAALGGDQLFGSARSSNIAVHLLERARQWIPYGELVREVADRGAVLMRWLRSCAASGSFPQTCRLCPETPLRSKPSSRT